MLYDLWVRSYVVLVVQIILPILGSKQNHSEAIKTFASSRSRESGSMSNALGVLARNRERALKL